MHPVTYFPVPTQRQLVLNRARIAHKPYARYFDESLWLHEEILPALRAPIAVANALPLTSAGLARLLEPGHHAAETGYCELPDGTAYVASRVPFPGCTGEMFRWWFWWHAVESERYALWYPHNHVACRSRSPERLVAEGLSHEERYVGTTHVVDELIGPDLVRVAIEFVDPSELGLDTARFDAAGVVAHACARVWLRGANLLAGTMVHLARQTPDGFELRSRYWLGADPRVRLPGFDLPVDGIARGLGIKRRMAGARVAYEQLLHDQIEFTHLASFLAAIHAEFGAAG